MSNSGEENHGCDCVAASASGSERARAVRYLDLWEKHVSLTSRLATASAPAPLRPHGT